MIYLLTNKFSKTEPKGMIIKSTKRYTYFVHHKIRLIPSQMKKNMIEVRKNIDNISTTDENNSQPKKSIANKHVKNKENSEITFGKQICENTANSTRILYQNTSSLSLTGSAHPLKEICNCMPTWNLDTCCLVETNTHWKHRKLKENY